MLKAVAERLPNVLRLPAQADRDPTIWKRRCHLGNMTNANRSNLWLGTRKDNAR